jgi:hypothetical protein
VNVLWTLILIPLPQRGRGQGEGAKIADDEDSKWVKTTALERIPGTLFSEQQWIRKAARGTVIEECAVLEDVTANENK